MILIVVNFCIMTALDLVSGSMYRNRHHRVREIQSQFISHLFILYDNLRADNNDNNSVTMISKGTLSEEESSTPIGSEHVSVLTYINYCFDSIYKKNVTLI